jgi:hypothetical protein
MSLAAYASPWSNDNNQTRKRQPSMRRTIKQRPYNEPSNMEPDDYTTQSEAFQTLDALKQSAPTTLDDIQMENNDKSEKVTELLNKITAFNAENDGNRLADFTPIDKPIITQNRETIFDANGYNKQRTESRKYLDPAELLPATLARQRMGPFIANEQPDIPYSNYNQTYDSPKLFHKPVAETIGNNQLGGLAGLDSKLIDKINYMIHLLEDQKYEKTANIAEEFILYIFLGVFVIYTVDSFTRAGKYIR